MYCDKKTKDNPRSFFDGIDKWAKEQGASGMAYFTLKKIKKFLPKALLENFFKKILRGNYEKNWSRSRR